MNEIFTDLLQTPSITWPIFAAWVVVFALLFGIVWWVWSAWPDENDKGLKDEEANRSARQQEKLTTFYQTGELPPKERITDLFRPVDAPPSWMEELLRYYQFSMELDGDTECVRLTDRRFFELQNKSIVLDMAVVMSSNYSALRRLLARCRSNINRRAISQGLIAKQTHRGRMAKVSRE